MCFETDGCVGNVLAVYPDGVWRRDVEREGGSSFQGRLGSSGSVVPLLLQPPSAGHGHHRTDVDRGCRSRGPLAGALPHRGRHPLARTLPRLLVARVRVYLQGRLRTDLLREGCLDGE